jgi:hypothetical protein
MAAKETKVFPVRGRTLPGVPAAVHLVPTKADADALVASGAFTLNGHDADRDDEAPDISGDGPLTHEQVRFLGEAAPDQEPQDPPDGGSSADEEN